MQNDLNISAASDGASVGKLVRRVGRKMLRAYNAHSPITRGKVRAVTVLNPFFSKLEPTEVTAVHSSIEMELDLREFVQQFIYYNVWEPHVRQVLLSILRPGQTLFDIGANVGYYTLLGAEAVGAGGAIHAFEANPKVFKVLRENVERNRFHKLSLNQVALTDANGQIEFSIDNVNPGSSSISGRGASSVTRVSVPSLILDSYVDRNSVTSVDVIKIDVEGSEVMVFRGGKQTLSRFRPDIVGEFSKDMMTRESGGGEELVELFASLGYRAFRLERDGAAPIPIHEIYEADEFARDLYLTTRATSPSFSK
jgi:FkbM family methyltransferase